MPDFEMCLSETCPASGRCRRHKASGTNPSHMQAYGYHEPGANGRCDVYLPRYEAEFPGGLEHSPGTQMRRASCVGGSYGDSSV